MACVNGESRAFRDHNAFLRWSALQDVVFNDPGDNNRKKIWSETNVFEDFDMALRLQVGVAVEKSSVFLIVMFCPGQAIHHSESVGDLS